MHLFDHWSITGIKAECFPGDSQRDILEEIVAWVKNNPDAVILGISPQEIDDQTLMTVFYE